MRSIEANNKELTKTRYYSQALYLSYFTVGYNFIEGFVSVLVGVSSGSTALVGFGLDSFVESLSGCVMIWRFSKAEVISDKEHERRESLAIKIVAYTFFVFSIYILYDSLKKLYLSEIANPSLIGIIIAIISIIVMPILYYLKNKVGKSIGSGSLVADSKQTLACLFLSVALLVGLGLNYLFAIWWADPIVGLFIFAYLIKEGYSTLKEEKICSC